jgi:2'-5' RNA ligase
MDKALVKMFVGIRVPMDIANLLGGFREAHFHAHQGVRWTENNDLHITLKYLGAQTALSAKLIVEGLDNISQSPVDISLNGSGIFEDVGVFFISVLPSPELMRLQAAVDQVALANGVSPSEHAYNPHISIARLSQELIGRGSSIALFNQMPSLLREFCQRLPHRHFRATEMTLFESVVGRYRVLRSFRL